MRGISSSRTNSYYDSEVREESKEGEGDRERERRKKSARIVFCFVRRVGGHHDDRIEHKRGAPEGVTGHKIPRLPSTLASRCRDFSHSHIKRTPRPLSALRTPCSSTVTVDPPFRSNLSYDRGEPDWIRIDSFPPLDPGEREESSPAAIVRNMCRRCWHH